MSPDTVEGQQAEPPLEDLSIGSAGRAPGLIRPKPCWGPKIRPAVAVDSFDIESLGLVVRAASLRGLDHQWLGKPRQDSYCLGAVKHPSAGEVFLVSVSDGVSQCPRAEEGADLVASLGCQVLSEVLSSGECVDWEVVIGDIASRFIAMGLERLGANAADREAREFITAEMAATSALLVVSRSMTEPAALEADFCTVGDSSIWLLGIDGHWNALAGVAGDSSSPYSTNEVAPLPFATLPSGVGKRVLSPREALFVMTDGIGTPLGSGRGDVGLRLAARWAEPPGHLQFASDAAFSRASFSDDRTVVGVWLRP